MKILLFCNLMPAKHGAFESFVSALGQCLRSIGDSLCAVFVGEPAAGIAAAFREAGVRWHTVEGWQVAGHTNPRAVILPGQEIIGQEKPDVVAIHFGNELPAAAMIRQVRRTSEKPTRWVWHQRQQIKPARGIKRFINRMRILSRDCDHFVALYEGGKRALIERKVPEEKIRVIHNGVADFSPQKPKGWLRRELGIPEDAVVVVNVSSLIARKRVDRTIDAVGASNIKHSTLNVQLLLVGEGPERGSLQHLVRQRGTESRVYFLGKRNDVREILAESDVFMLTSEAEASPLALIEAMAAGLPAVATDAGAASELVDEGATGFVVAQVDQTALEQKLQLLVEDKALRQRMGESARRRWQEHFTLDRMVDEHIELYRSLL